MNRYIASLLTLTAMQAFASGSKPPTSLSQDVTCFAIPKIDDKQPPVDLSTIKPDLIVHLQISAELGMITVLEKNSEHNYNGTFSNVGPKQADAVVKIPATDKVPEKYETTKVQTLQINLSTEPSPYPSMDLFVPVDINVLNSNRDYTNRTVLTTLTTLQYSPESGDNKTVPLSSVCYLTHSGG